MKKKLCVLLLGLCLFSVSACGDKTASTSSIDSASKQEEEAEEAGNNSSAKDNIKIEDISWNVDEGIVDGERYILLSYINNTKYTIAGFEIQFTEKSDITEEEKTAFYTDIQEKYEISPDEMESLKGKPISMYAEAEIVVNPGESVTNTRCWYYRGYHALRDLSHFQLVQPDIATIRYVDNDKIYTVYYDYSSGKYSAESETETAYQWTQTDLGNKIPKPDVIILECHFDDEDTFMFEAYGISLEGFNAYVAECQKLGYTVDASSHEGFYRSDNAEGYNIYMHYDEDEKTMHGDVSAPEQPESDTSDSEDDNITDNTDNSLEELVDGMRPAFKEAMDRYEKFMTEYCEFIKIYSESNGTDPDLLADYTDYMLKYADRMQDFEAYDIVTITIPQAQVLDCKVDETTLTEDSFIVAKGSAAVEAEHQTAAFQEAQARMQESASSDTALLANAQQRAQKSLEDYVHNIGDSMGKAYKIKWIYLEGDEPTQPETTDNATEESAESTQKE